MSLPAGSVKGCRRRAVGNAAFSASFYYVTVQLQVSATSPAVGSVLTPPVTDLVVQFNEAFDPYTINDRRLPAQPGHGRQRRAAHVAGRRPDPLRNHPGRLPDPDRSRPARSSTRTASPTSPSPALTSSRSSCQPYPTPLQGSPPAGSLIYDPSVTGAIGFVGDTDTYTLPLAAGQTLSLVLTTDPSLIGTITVLDPSGNTIGSADGARRGARRS